MGRVENRAGPLTTDELRLILEVVNAGGKPGDVRKRLPSRDRITTNRAYNVVVEFERLGLTSLDDAVARKIAETAKYSTSITYVQDLFIKWRALKGGLPFGSAAHRLALRRHYRTLSDLLKQLNNELSVPNLSELCLLELKDGTPISYGYGTEPDMKYAGGGVTLEVEQSDPLLWHCLEEHLKAGSANFAESFRDWKQGIGSIVQGCHGITEIIAGQLAEMGWHTAEPCLAPGSDEWGPGVYNGILIESLYKCVVYDHAPKFNRLSVPLVQLLVMEHATGTVAVACGHDGLLGEVERFCLSVAGNDRLKNAVNRVRESTELAEGVQETIKPQLQLMVARGTFKGTCIVCSELYVAT